MIELLSYYNIVLCLHLASMFIWLFSVTYILFYLFRFSKGNEHKVKYCINKIEMPSSFLVPLSGFLLLIENISLFWQLLFIAKIILALIAFIITIYCRQLLEIDSIEVQRKKIIKYNLIILIILLMIILIVIYK